MICMTMLGLKHSKNTKEKIRAGNLGKHYEKSGKTLEELYGKSKASKILRKYHIANIGERNPMFGRHKHKTYNQIYGEKKATQIKKKKSLSMNGKNKGANCSKETRKKKRISALRYIATKRANGDRITPNIGLNETNILNYIEKQNNIKLKRQYYIDGYFLDGYDAINNTAYEVDEKHHHSEKQKKRDKERQEYIINKLNCKFIRLDEKEYLKRITFIG